MPKSKSKLVCNGCTACCEYVSIYLEKPKSPEDIDEIRWFFLHGMKIYIDKDGWFVEVPSRCQALSAKGLCKIYKNRPGICRSYSQKECEKYAKNAGVIRFENYENFLLYAKKDTELSKIL